MKSINFPLTHAFEAGSSDPFRICKVNFLERNLHWTIVHNNVKVFTDITFWCDATSATNGVRIREVYGQDVIASFFDVSFGESFWNVEMIRILKGEFVKNMIAFVHEKSFCATSIGEVCDSN